MIAGQLLPLLPVIVVACAAVVAMLAVAWRRKHETTVGITVAGLGLALSTLFFVPRAPTRQVTALLVFDNLALFYLGLVLAASLFVAVMGYGYFSKRQVRPDEFYMLLLTATSGCGVLVAASHFASFFLGLEILSVSLYAMVAYSRDEQNSIEAGVKYLVLAAGSAAFLLFGMALLYAETGSMDFVRIAAATDHAGVWTLLGLALMVVGIGFKLAVAPFHMWTPDVYQGAPAPATAFVATVSKGAVFAVLLRFFTLMNVQSRPTLIWAFVVMAVGSMLVGNLLALLQTNVKRILAYSSIANLGYLLVAFLAGGPLAFTAAAYYLTAYFATVLGAFAVVIHMSGKEREADAIEDYRGLFWRNPWVAAAFTTMMLSLAGIPLTAGFIAKFYVLAAGGQSARWILVSAVVLNSTIGLYYYLRVILAMCAPLAEEDSVASRSYPAAASSWSVSAVLVVLTSLVVFLGIYPLPLIQLVGALVGGTTGL